MSIPKIDWENKLIITLPFHMRPSDKEIMIQQINNQLKDGGVVTLPPGSKVLIAPPDVEVVVEEEAES